MKRLSTIQYQNLIFVKIFLTGTVLMGILKIVIA